MKVRQHFDFLANFYDDWDSARALALADSLDLDVDARVGSLSRGNSLKVALCSALGQDAKLLLLDEPTAGLDPVARLDCCTDSSRTCTPNRMSPWYSPRTYWKIWTTWISRTCWYCGREGSRSNGPATSPSRTEACHGSLRFLASLPISGPEHAAGRILVAATFAVPATLVITVVAVREQFVSLAASVPAGLLVWAALTAISTLITACHYRFAGERMLGLFARVALDGVVGSFLISTFVPPELAVLAWLASPTGRTVAAALAVGAAVAPFWWAVRTINCCAPVHQDTAESEFLAMYSMMEHAFQRKWKR